MSLWARIFRPRPRAECMEILRGLNLSMVQMMTTLSELTETLQEISSQLEKAKVEIVTRIDDLQSSLSNIELPAEASAALENLRSAAQGLDDIVPDAPPVEG